MSIPPSSAAPSASSSAQFTYNATPSSSAATTSSYFPLPFHLQQPDPTTYPQPYVAPPPAPVVPSVYSAPVYSLPQYHQVRAVSSFSFCLIEQAQQLFQRDAQTITPEALESVKAALASSEIEHKAETKKKAIPRKAAGQTWEDPTLSDWPESIQQCPMEKCGDGCILDDYRLFCGDLGNEVNDDVLSKAFSRFPSFNMAKVSFIFT
ncbi:hypothetical protein Patl1_23169 [Pistacia atlantica]|uniref:Uncharacterized protein n=1 Tax=Pistacia atlantica TaxID=434234 RepID=A0ACC0ZZH8_9ROSI|nr:hypothetical protein Patl1_23169 [Pistacia atlantica]